VKQSDEKRKQLTKLIKRRFNIIKFQSVSLADVAVVVVIIVVAVNTALDVALVYFNSTCAIFIVALACAPSK